MNSKGSKLSTQLGCEIELGKMSWSDDPQQIESAILAKY